MPGPDVPNRRRYSSAPRAITSTSCSFTSIAFFTLSSRFRIASSGINFGSARPLNIAGRSKYARDCHERCNSDPHPTPEIRSRG
ncbi:hypothetical protein AWP72_02310 [Escherichia coli]|nr:hypothetical protein AWP72_02310 [Escherichia coli]